jgi:Predicted membrane protein
MILVGLLALGYGRKKTRVSWRYFGFGALIWALAIGTKLLMDLTVTTPFYQSLYSYSALAALIGLSLYVGLRTGLLESGLSYLGIRHTQFRSMNLPQALAFGIGFGSVEAIALGIPTLINLVVFILDPSLVEMLSPAQQASLSVPTMVAFAAIIERASVIIIHVFASVLVVLSLVSGLIRYLVYSILYKTILDGMLPVLTTYIDTTTVLGIYSIEVPIVLLGLGAFIGTRGIMKLFNGKYGVPLTELSPSVVL